MAAKSKILEHRVFRCSGSDYYSDEILQSNQTHTDEKLRAIADAGFTGIWLHAILRDLTPTDLFKRYVRNSEKRLDALKRLCERSKRYGLDVWIYCTEPLGLDENHPFWKVHPELKGHRTFIPVDPPAKFALCSSTPAVQNFLEEGFERLFQRVPLKGVILITASEHISNCWAHTPTNPSYANPFPLKKCHCPRCSSRTPKEVISEIITLINRGVKSARPDAKVVAWDWSWNMHFNPPYQELVDMLPKDVILMGDFERGGRVIRKGKSRFVEEYSLIYPGPSSRFRGEVRITTQKRPLWAKLQVNTTHELATVPNLPLVVSLYRKFKFLREARTNGIMATWNFGCALDTLNIFAVRKLTLDRSIGTEKSWLEALAREYFGAKVDAQKIVRAWYGFQRACSYYPLNGLTFLYSSPMNYSLAYPLKLKFENKPMGPSWLKHSFGDRLEDTLSGFTEDEIIYLLGKLSDKWLQAVDDYEQGLANSDRVERKVKELNVAKIIGCCFRSTWNIYRWYKLRKHKRTQKLSKSEREIIADELSNLQIALPLVKLDTRLGYHEEARWYMFTPKTINQKIRDLKKLIN